MKKMKNTFGNSVAVTLFGESHGEAVGVVIDGLAPGIEVDAEYVKLQLGKRRPSGKTDTPRRENDNFQILSGVFNGKTSSRHGCLVGLTSRSAPKANA